MPGIAHLYKTLSQYERKRPHVEKSCLWKRVVDVLVHLIALVLGLVAAHLMLALALIQFEVYEAAQRKPSVCNDVKSSSAHLFFAQVNAHYDIIHNLASSNDMVNL